MRRSSGAEIPAAPRIVVNQSVTCIDLVARATGFDPLRPAHDARSAQVALSACEVGALPETRCAAPEEHVFRPVVACEDGERVVCDTDLLE
jgi:hypothetical protein